MSRAQGKVASRTRRKKIVAMAKGYRGRNKNNFRISKQRVEKGLQYAYRDRRVKKRSFRALWIQRINAGTRLYGISYSQFMGSVHKKGINLNRKVLADLAMNHPKAFKAVVDKVK